MVIDLGGLPVGAGEVEFPLLVGLLRGYGMIPFGVRGGTKAQNKAAEAMELAILGETYTRAARSADAQSQSETGRRPARAQTRVRIEAQLQAGHAPGTLGSAHLRGRGRPLGGRPGELRGRIDGRWQHPRLRPPARARPRRHAGRGRRPDLHQDLQAELISVAGHYRVSENIPADLRGMPVQVYLDDKVLRIEKL